MTFFQAIVLGVVQGLTEFIPVSSTAHLIFACRAVGLFDGVDVHLQAEQTTATIAVIQLGTLAAVFVYFARDIFSIGGAFARDHLAFLKSSGAADESRTGELSFDHNLFDKYRARLSHQSKIGWFVIIGSVPIGAVGLLFKDVIEGTLTKNLWVIAAMLIIVAILLTAAEAVGSKRRDMTELGLRDAVIVGCAQVLSLIPGASRAGSTIMGGLFAGQTRETAARFSFLLSIPAIAASGLLELKEALVKLPADSLFPVMVAVVVSGIVGYLSIWFLLSLLKKRSLGIFILYRVIIGVLIMIMLSFGFISAN